MSEKAIELPLFPLAVVLFPGTELPLRIFEPRYRLMINECLSEKKPFGVVLAQPNSIHRREKTYPVGTLAEPMELQRFSDGRIDIMANGKQRFRILSEHRTKPYLCGMVELYEDDSEPLDMLISSVRQAQYLFTAYLNVLLEAVGREDIHPDLPTAPEALSHFIAHFLDVQDEQRQHFLELTSTQQRLQEEITILRREVPFMRQMLNRKVPEDRSMLN